MNIINIEYIQGDIFKAFEDKHFNFLLHQCNCTVGMGAGIARIIKDKYPSVSKMDNKLIHYDVFQNEFPLKVYGNSFINKVDENKYVVNLYSQFYIGSPEKVDNNDNFYGRKQALKRAFKHFLIQVESLGLINKTIEIGMPLIASDLAADSDLKEGLNTLEYFQRYIEECFIESKYIGESIKINIKVYYLESALLKIFN